MSIKRFFRASLTVTIVVSAVLVTAPARAFTAIDAAGIETRDTASSGPSPSEFVDIAATCGAACRITATDDQVIGVAPPAGQPNWPFHWSSGVTTAGVAGGTIGQSTVWLDTNGYIAFVQPSGSSYTPSSMPTAGGPNGLVAGVWTDLNPAVATTGNGIYQRITGSSPNRLMYLQWQRVPDFGATCSGYTFQFVLAEADNSVTVHYRSNTCTNRVAIGGQENSAGTAGTTYFNGTAIPSNIAVVYRDIVAPQIASPAITCTTPGSASWCRSSTNTITITDNDDRADSAVGVGVKSRSWMLGHTVMPPYSNGSGISVTRPDGNHTASVAAVDWAGNRGSSSAILKVDATAPTLSASMTPAANAAGWNNSDVVVAWTCGDATSGVPDCPAAQTLTGEGVGLSATTTVADVAGNSTTTTSPTVKIDRTPPSTTAQAPQGWSTSDTVTLTPADALSGVAITKYRIDGSPAQTGTTLQLAEGVHEVEFWSEDVAGNVETATRITVKVDRSAPAIVHSISPAPNDAGWNSTAATVSFMCEDSVSAIASCTPPSTLAAEGASQRVDGHAVDLAGNTAQDFALVNIDRTAPMIGATRDPQPNAQGWNNTPVTVEFSCADALSGIASCPASQVLRVGAEQTAGGVARDAAGNQAQATVGGINVDLIAPQVSAAVSPPANAAGWHTGDVTVTWTCSDDLSGVANCPAPNVVTGEGSRLLVAVAVFDRAGNATMRELTVNIDRSPPVLRFEGQAPEPNDAGWSRAAVAMFWSCEDDLSSTATPTIVKRLTAETPGTDETATCDDNAGLRSTDTRGPVRIDLTSPLTTISSPAAVPLVIDQPATGGALADRIRGSAVDALSGTDSVLLTVRDVTGGGDRIIPADCVQGCGSAGTAVWEVPAQILGTGMFHVSAHSVDRAGNEGDPSPETLVIVLAS